jgi:hypothetical protein
MRVDTKVYISYYIFNVRKGRDSNPRGFLNLTVFKTVPLNHSGTFPKPLVIGALQYRAMLKMSELALSMRGRSACYIKRSAALFAAALFVAALFMFLNGAQRSINDIAPSQISQPFLNYMNKIKSLM